VAETLEKSFSDKPVLTLFQCHSPIIALPGIDVQDNIYDSSNSLVYWGIRGDGLVIVIKMFKQNYPSPSELICYRQEYEIICSIKLEGVVKEYSQQED
jgi:hypothetical protein